jgi:outer membrane protein assembly factor BamB
VRRRRPPFGLALWLGLCLAFALWVRVADPAGDRGVVNVLTALALLVAALSWFLWFTLASAFSARLRLGLGLAVPLGLALAALLVRVEGVSGEMIPSLAWRSGRGPGLVEQPASSPAGIDLRTTTPHDFPGFLGRERDGTVPGVALDPDWAARPPELLWRRPIGAGWSGFAVVNGWAVTQEERSGPEGPRDLVSAWNVETGELAWTCERPGGFEHFLGGAGPRATPLVDQGRVYALTARGVLRCLDGARGELLWERDLLAEYGVSPEDEQRNVQYGRANSPLVVGELVIVPAGGNPGGRQAGLAAFDRRTGQPRWQGPPRQISFSSPRLATLCGREQVLIVNEDTLSGHDPSDGRLLWEHPWPGVTSASASASQAVPVPPERVLVSKGYGGGAALLQLLPRDDGTCAVQELWHDPRSLRTKLTNVVRRGDCVYGLDDGMLECVELETGERRWKEGRYGHGQLLLVGEHLLVVSEQGEVLLIEARADRPNSVLGRFQALQGKTWNHPAFFRDLLVLRNAGEAAVWRLALQGGNVRTQRKPEYAPGGAWPAEDAR